MIGLVEVAPARTRFGFIYIGTTTAATATTLTGAEWDTHAADDCAGQWLIDPAFEPTGPCSNGPCALGVREHQSHAGLRPATRMNALVLVSGFMAPGLEWRRSPLRTEATAHARKAIYFHARLPFGPIHSSAERLADLVRSLRQDFDGVALLGHSMGGLVAVHASLLEPVDAVVTIGTPHQGVTTPLQAIIQPICRATRQMAAGSRYLSALDVPASPLLAVVCRRDRLVRPDRSAPVRPHDELLVDTGHVGAIFSTEVAAGVFAWLDRMVPA